MSKLLVLLIAAALIYFAVRGMARRSGGAPPPSPRAERMVECRHCGVNVPQSEALESRGRFYCSEEHRRLAG